MKKIRCVYNDGNSLEFTTDNASKYTEIDRSRLESVVLFDGEKEIDSVTFPKGFTFAYRMRNRGKLSDPSRERIIVLGIVNKNEQILHFINEDNKIEIIDTPEEFALYGKINLREDEVW